jgi:hypothetical protein
MLSMRNKLQYLLSAIMMAALALASVGSAGASGNLIVNGGFELGLVGPGTYIASSANSNIWGAWTSSVGAGCTGETALLGMPFAGLPAYEGFEAMHLGYCRQPGAVSQSFATTIGQVYQVRLAAIGWNGEAGLGSIQVYNSSFTDLSATFSAPGGTCGYRVSSLSLPRVH